MKKRQGGLLYLGVLLFVALMGVSLTTLSAVWSFERSRQRERQLLDNGQEMQRAIKSYYENSPGLVKHYPASLNDLLRDNRFLYVRRHLRKIYVDPIIDEQKWLLIEAPEGGVMGVASTSEKVPIKQAGFPDLWTTFNSQKKYSDWHFIYRPTNR